MSNRKKTIGNLLVIILLFCFRAGMAHQPDLSSLMIYEQNGKTVLLIKSSLIAFEQEIAYIYGKDSYKTPQEFQQLVINHLQKKCAVKLNDQSLTFTNSQVLLGHETTVFAELSNQPKNIKSLYIKNEIFKDMPNNICEVIIALNGYPQKQLVFGHDSSHEASLDFVNENWEIVEKIDAFWEKIPTIIMGLLALIGVFFLVLKKKIFKRIFEKK